MRRTHNVLCFRCGSRITPSTTTCPNCNADLGSLARAMRIPKRTLTAMKAIPVFRPDSTNVGDLPFRLGETLQQRYTLQAPLGNGPFGVVFKARDALHNTNVALKLFRPTLFATPDAQTRFHTALSHTRTINLPSLPTPTDHGFARNCAFVVTPILAGLNLQRLLEFHGQRAIDPTALSNLAQQLLSALLHLHKHHAHSDLKLTNLILDSDQLSITDYYLHRALLPQLLHSTYNPSSSLHPSTFSQDTSSTRSDIYSCAFILHTLLTGSPPDPSNPPPSSKTPIHWTLHRALQTNPKRSFRSFENFARSVAEALQFALPNAEAPHTPLNPSTGHLAPRTTALPSDEHTPRRRSGEKTLRDLPTPSLQTPQESIQLSEDLTVPPPPTPSTSSPFATVAQQYSGQTTGLLPAIPTYDTTPNTLPKILIATLIIALLTLAGVLTYAVFIHPSPSQKSPPTPDTQDVNVIQNFGKQKSP